MIDGNISMEEDTELRDLVVQTLENNGVLAKVRAELRASIFLTLEEQESVLNPDPFLNKSVKQYLSNSEGKLLFSLVREFLEYFGLDYTMSVYDPETYFGKEYNYAGREKLCEELGINSNEPLLGQILKNTIKSALHSTVKNDSSEIILNRTRENEKSVRNATFDISIPNVLVKETTGGDRTDESENASNSTNGKMKIIEQNLSSQNMDYHNIERERQTNLDINQDLIIAELKINENQETHKDNKVVKEIQIENNTKIKNYSMSNTESRIYFDEVIDGGIKQKIMATKDGELLLSELLPMTSSSNSLFANLPPLNGKKANMNDLKELIDIAQGISQYEEDIASSVLTNVEKKPLNVLSTPESLLIMQTNNQKSINNAQSIKNENENVDIIEEIPNSSSQFENILNPNVKNMSTNTKSSHIGQNL